MRCKNAHSSYLKKKLVVCYIILGLFAADSRSAKKSVCMGAGGSLGWLCPVHEFRAVEVTPPAEAKLRFLQPREWRVGQVNSDGLDGL